MNMIFRLIGLDFSDLKRRGMWMVGGGFVAAIFATLTFGFLGVAVFVALLDHMTPLSAALITAAGSFVICIVVLLITMRFAGAAKTDANAAMRTSAIAALSPTMIRLAARHTGIAGAVAVVVATFAYLEGRRR